MTDQPITQADQILPQNCIAAPGEPGDCYRACLASIIGHPIENMPNFGKDCRNDPENMEQMWDEVRAYLAPFNMSIFNNYCNGDWSLEKVLEWHSEYNKGVPIILTGKPTHSSDPGHSVVVLDGKIVHDPSGAGISGPSGDWWFYDVVALANHRAAPSAELVEWLNVMPHALVADFAFNSGCQQKTADRIRSGDYTNTRLEADMMVGLVGFLQDETRQALASSASVVSHEDPSDDTQGALCSFDDRQSSEGLAGEISAAIEAWHDCSPQGQGEGWSDDADEKRNAMCQLFYDNSDAILSALQGQDAMREASGEQSEDEDTLEDIAARQCISLADKLNSLGEAKLAHNLAVCAVRIKHQALKEAEE